MYSSSCRVTAEKPNGSKAVTLLLRLSTLALSLTSAVVMATASECTITGHGGAKVTITFKNYRPFVYLVVLSITAAVLEAAAIYLQVVGNGEGGEEEAAPKLPRIILVVLDVAVPALVNTATGAVVSAVIAYGPEINACTAAGAGGGGRFCEQVSRSKLLSIAASIAASSAAVAKDVPLPFSVWPMSSEADDCSY